jgi:hypothetical protein
VKKKWPGQRGYQLRQWSKSKGLADLDVSNNLTVQIPTSSHLMTFPPSRYENNSGLCGVHLPLPPCASVNNGDDEHEPQDFPDDQVHLVPLTGVGIGLPFGFILGVGSMIFFRSSMPAILVF